MANTEKFVATRPIAGPSAKIFTRRRCAGPRAVRQRQLTLYAAHDSAADTVGSAAAAVLDPVHWPDIAGSPASVASAAPPAGMLHCKSDSADAAANTAVHIP